ncbi:unnamed protein product [Cochlearia groenlandica]
MEHLTTRHCPDESRPSRRSRSQNSSSAKAKPKPQDCRSHKCKRGQGIVRTSLVHQDDDLACDEGRSHKLPNSLALLVTVAKGNKRRRATLLWNLNLASATILVGARASSLLGVSFTGHRRCPVFSASGKQNYRAFPAPDNKTLGACLLSAILGTNASRCSASLGFRATQHIIFFGARLELSETSPSNQAVNHGRQRIQEDSLSGYLERYQLPPMGKNHEDCSLWSRLLLFVAAAIEFNNELTNDDEKWFQLDQKVLGIIQGSLEPSILEAYSYCENAKEL